MKYSWNKNMSLQQVPQSLISKSVPLYSVAAFFSKNISTPIYKMANTLSVDSQVKPLKLTSRLHPPIFV